MKFIKVGARPSVHKLALFCILMLKASASEAQTLKSIIKKVAAPDSAGKVNSILKSVSGTSALSNTDIISGLKEALTKGVNNGVGKLSLADGFFQNAAVKILIPEDAKRVESTLRKAGMGKVVDDAILSMNRAAEDATKNATPIFMNALKEMTFTDAKAILTGTDTAATSYLRTKTSLNISNAFKPVIQSSLDKVNATKYWSKMMSAYNTLPLVKKVNTDLNSFVTERAVSGLFFEIAQQETLIRKDPAARTTDLLKKVFGK